MDHSNATDDLPSDETFIAAGLIESASPSGGGYVHSPTFTTITIGGRCFTIRNSSEPRCARCHLSGRRGHGSYGPGSEIVLSMLHGHHVIRVK